MSRAVHFLEAGPLLQTLQSGLMGRNYVLNQLPVPAHQLESLEMELVALAKPSGNCSPSQQLTVVSPQTLGQALELLAHVN